MVDDAWVRRNFSELSEVAHIGSGGQKTVFGGIHPVDGRVALKLILNPSSDARIGREVLAVQQIRSTRVPRIHATGTVDDTLWLREQRIDGQSLRAVVKGAGRVQDSKFVARLAVQMLEALHAAEAQGIVHRDVKPDNIMVDLKGDFWLLDFGCARLLGMDSLTATNALGGPGTVGYAPEEQYRNRKSEIDGRADLFALGVTLWELWNGVNPFRHQARDAFEVFRRLEGVAPAPIIITGPGGSELSALTATLMQRRRDHRPASVGEALEWARAIHCEA